MMVFVLRDWIVEGDEESVKAYAMIDVTNENWKRLYANYAFAPKEKTISMGTVMENRRKIAEISARFKGRAANWTEGPRGS